MTTKQAPPPAEQFFYDVRFTDGGRCQVTADDVTHVGLEALDVTHDAWLVFRNRGDEVFRHRISRLAGWSRMAKPGVPA